MEGENYSAAEVSYYYHNAYNSYRQNSNYVSLYGIDKNTALVSAEPERHRQDDVGVSPSDMTWDAYFRDRPPSR